LSAESSGRQSKSILLDELNKFYDSHFVKILNNNKSCTKFNATSLASIREASIIEMLTSYKSTLREIMKNMLDSLLIKALKRNLQTVLRQICTELKEILMRVTY